MKVGSFQPSLPCPLVKNRSLSSSIPPKLRCRESVDFEGYPEQVCERSVLPPSPIRRTLFSLPFLPFPPLPLSCVPSPQSQFPVAFLPSAPFLFYHPSRLYRLATPPASPLSKHPLPPFPSSPNTPLPPALQTDESKLSGFTSFEPGLFFFPRPPDEKLRDTLRRAL